MTRASQTERGLERGSPNHSHPCTPTCELQAKKNMLLMIRNGDRPSQSLRVETRGLDSKIGLFSCHSNPRPEPRGCPGRPTLKESLPFIRYHRRPIASIIHMQSSQDKPVPTKVEKDRYARQASHGLPYESPGGWFRAGSCKAQENLPIPLSFQKTRPLSNNQTNGALTKSNGSRTSTNPSQGADGMNQEPCRSET